ncbi:MAG TPA: hypothetical protein DEG69_23270, partial [Flavobacteriaceae bacterium]|nr:hypothetical protein [Flavobacteriaceae bacterium]
MKTYSNRLAMSMLSQKIIVFFCLVCLSGTVLQAQEKQIDSLGLLPVYLDEVLLIGHVKELKYQTGQKPLATLDEYLEGAQKVNMIKRGAYAWEPSLNNMTSERLVVTIDGMQI